MIASASLNESDRAAATHDSWSSGNKPFAIDIGKYGILVVSMKSRTSFSAWAIEAPLPRIISGFLAFFKTSTALSTASTDGRCCGAGSSSLIKVLSGSMFSSNKAPIVSAGKSR